MTQRHPVQNDHTMFVTLNTRRRYPYFLEETMAREVIETLYRVRDLRSFFLYAFVVMPDHIHLLARIPWPLRISNIIGEWKSGTTFNTGVYELWQKRFHLQLAKDVSRSLEYIHQNPVKAGLVESSSAYPWSSASGKWKVDELEIF